MEIGLGSTPPARTGGNKMAIPKKVKCKCSKTVLTVPRVRNKKNILVIADHNNTHGNWCTGSGTQVE